MARAIWSGVLTFGLVSVPVELYSATEAHGLTDPIEARRGNRGVPARRRGAARSTVMDRSEALRASVPGNRHSRSGRR